MNQANTTFSGLNRQTDINQLQSETFDLLIIGGGVTGAGIALDAASRGLKTALIEKSDFASGTSSKSTKLIHGGLRYLKQLEIGLVRETGTERAIVHGLAPHLAIPEKMLLPIIKGGTFGKLTATIAIKVYDFLAGVTRDDRMKVATAADALKREPLLDKALLKAGIFYTEYRTDDARLTIELIKKAKTYSALPLNYCEAKQFIYENEELVGVECYDGLDGQHFSIKAKKIVSATGPWVDGLRKIDQSLTGKRLHHTKGVHLVFDHKKLPLEHSIYFDVPDGRMIFAIPRGRITYVGTTDTNYHQSLDQVTATSDDVTYLLKAVNHAFPSINLQPEDVESSWAGLRPLIHQDGKSASELSRKDEIFEAPSGLISIAGGKLTGYRKMAERVVDLVVQQLGIQDDGTKTDKISLTEKPFQDFKSVLAYQKRLEEQLSNLGLTAYHAWYLTTTYGQSADLIIERLPTSSDTPEIALARAELWYGVHHEMVTQLTDFFIRRTGQLYFDIHNIKRVQTAIIKDMQTYFQWSEQTIKKQQALLSKRIDEATIFTENEITDKQWTEQSA